MWGRTAAGLAASAEGIRQGLFGPPTNSTTAIKGGRGGWMSGIAGPAGYSLLESMRAGRQRGGLAGMWDPLRHFMGWGYTGASGGGGAAGMRGLLERDPGAGAGARRGLMAKIPSIKSNIAAMDPYLRTIAGGDVRAKMRAAAGTFRGRNIAGGIGVGIGAVGIGATVGWGNVASVGAYGLAGGAAGMLAGSVLGGARGWGRGLGKAGAFGGAVYGGFRAMGVF